ncbi:site-specific integrase [Corynebacterium sp. H127]|uniref:tyrosine-type recombinase/integrase n=1 Tax=Corynebacterium sp. H127 TaxID=3133418 RepID=UPI0030A4FBB9
MASVQPYTTKKGTRYRVQYVDQYGKPSGKRGFLTAGAAKKFAATVTVEVSQGTFIAPSAGETTVGELAAIWLDTRTHMKISTQNLMQLTWDTHIDDEWSHIEIASIKHSHVQRWVSLLAKDMSASSVRRCHSVLAQILDIGVNDRLIPNNPARKVRLPRKKKSEQIFLTLSQVRALAKDAKYPEIIWVLATTGLRWGELCVLRPRDVDVKRRRISVSRAMVRDGSTKLIGDPKTHEKRTVAVPSFVCNMLAPLVEGADQEALIWPARDGGPMISPGHKTWFAGAVDKCVASGEIPARITPHGLRHVAAGLLVSAGANVKIVQKQLGHASAVMTLDTYASLFDGDLDEVADVLDLMNEGVPAAEARKEVTEAELEETEEPDIGALEAV